MSKLTKIQELQKRIAETGKDLTKPSAGGGDYAPPVEGPTRLRFIRYVELGIHTTTYKGAPKRKPRAEFTFELSGPKHPPKKLEDGTLIPARIKFKETVGYTEKNGYMKLFKLMNAGGTAKTFLDLLGSAFLGTVSHYTFKRADGSSGVVAQLKDNGVYSIRGTTYEDPESGETRTVQVSDPLGKVDAFLWDYADLEDWDNLFVDGEFDDGKTKNVLQETIKSAENFPGSPVFDALIEAGREAETVPAAASAPAEEGEDDEQAPPAKEEKKATAPTAPKAPASPPKKATKPKAAPKAADADEGGDADPLRGL